MIGDFSKHQRMNLGYDIGDTKGAGDEFRYPDLKSYQDIPFDKYTKSPFKDFDHSPGMSTDDTQTFMAVEELLISDKEFTKENLADKIVECYKRDPVKGMYHKSFQNILDSVNSGEEFIKKINPNSIRNGAATRAVPIGVVPDIDTVVEYAIINASLTHDTSKGRASSVAVALMSHMSFHYGYMYCDTEIFRAVHYGGDIHSYADIVRSIIIPRVKLLDAETATYMNDVLDMKKFDPVLLFGKEHSTKGVPCDGMRTVGAALYLLTKFTSPKDILIESVKLGGDVDSVAAISLGIGLVTDYYVGCLPSFLFDDLANHAYGRDYLLSLGDKLSSKFPYVKQ